MMSGADLVVEGTNRKRKQNEAESSAKETPHYSSPFSDQGEDDGKLLEQDRDPSLSCDNDCDEDEAKKEDDGVGRPTKRKKTAKFKKHPNAPKRFRSAFIIFSQQRHKDLRAKLNAEGGEADTMNIAGQISEEWRSIRKEAKMKWDDMARSDKERYEREKARYEGPWKVRTNLRKPKDPNSPKKPVPAYFAFSNERRQEVKNQNPSASNGEISRLLSTMWKEAHEDVRKIYIEREAREREKYTQKMTEWKKSRKKEAEEGATQLARIGGGLDRYNSPAGDLINKKKPPPKPEDPIATTGDYMLAPFQEHKPREDPDPNLPSVLPYGSSRSLEQAFRRMQEGSSSGTPLVDTSSLVAQQHSQLPPAGSSSQDSALLSQLLLGTQQTTPNISTQHLLGSSDGGDLLMRQALMNSSIQQHRNLLGAVNPGYNPLLGPNSTSGFLPPLMQPAGTSSFDPTATNGFMNLLQQQRQSSSATGGTSGVPPSNLGGGDQNWFYGGQQLQQSGRGILNGYGRTSNTSGGGRVESTNNQSNENIGGMVDNNSALLRRILAEQRGHQEQFGSGVGGERNSNVTSAEQQDAFNSFLLGQLSGAGRGGIGGNGM